MNGSTTASPVAEAQFAEALALHQSGRLDGAERLYLAILSANEAHIPSLLHLGSLRLQQGRHDEALGLARQALQHAPNSAEAHGTLGTALHMLGRNEEAVSCYEAALTLDPNGAEAYYGLGLALHALSRHDEAVACHERALAIDPDYAEASCALGAALNALMRHDRAAEYYRRAIDVDPDYVEAICGLAGTLELQGNHEEAVAHFHSAVAKRPGHPPTLDALANALQATGRHREAVEWLRESIRIEPDRGNTNLRLGVVLEELGQISESRIALERAYALGSEDPRCFFTLTNARPVREGDSIFASLARWERRLETAGRDEEILIRFALAKALADIGRRDESFRHLLVGNQLKRGTLMYDENRALNVFQKIEEMFTPEMIARYSGIGHSSTLPILIVGIPRSGSTLIEQILASHSAVFAGGERRDLVAAMSRLGVDPSASDFPRSCASLERDQISRIGADYAARLSLGARAAGVVNAARVTDKMLANLPLIGLVHLALPNARIICTKRDPIDNFMSCFSKLFAEDIPYAYEPGEFGRYYRACDRLMAHWQRVLPRGAVLDVQYEELVADFELQARRIIAHCGLDWEPTCLAYYATERPVQTASATQVRQPIYQTSVNRWRPDAKSLQPLIDALNLST